MKKFAMILSLVLSLALLAGCAGTTVVYTNCTCGSEGNAVTGGAQQETVDVTEGSVKTGLAVVGSMTVDNEAHTATYDVTLAAVLVDDNDVIVDCAIDCVSATVEFDETGAAVTADGEVLTKYELGYDYGMVKYQASTMEWFEQADALAAYAVGKTVEQLKTGAVDETGHAQDADLATSATIYLGGYVSAIEEAVSNAKHLGAQAGDELKLASINAVSDGGLNCDVVALTLSGETITSCYIDALQATAGVAGDGSLAVSDVLSKNELGYDYGMVKYQVSTMEWFEQAENFCAYVTGKTAAEVAGIAVTETTAPAEADLAASVTIAIGGFQNLIAKAAQ